MSVIIGIGYDTTRQNNGTVQDAFRELMDDLETVKNDKRITVKNITIPTNMPQNLLSQITVAAGSIPCIFGPSVKLEADGTEESLCRQTISIEGGPIITFY